MHSVKRIVKIAFLLAIVACNKKSNSPAPSPGNPPSNNSGNISGMFIHEMVINAKAGNTASDTMILPTCMFYSTAIVPNQAPLPASVDVGVVKVNGVTLQKSADPVFYAAGNDSIHSLPLVFSVGGSQVFGATGFTDNGKNFPGCSNLAQLPDTISKAAGLTFTLANAVNFSAVEVYLGNLTEGFAGNTITFTPAQLSGLNTGGSYYLKMVFQNGSVKTLTAASKNYQCTYQTEFLKTGVAVVP